MLHIVGLFTNGVLPEDALCQNGLRINIRSFQRSSRSGESLDRGWIIDIISRIFLEGCRARVEAHEAILVGLQS